MGTISFAGALAQIADGAPKAAAGVSSVVDATAKVADAAKAAADALDNLDKKLAAVNTKMADAPKPAAAAGDAFGNLASKFGEMTFAADHATDGLAAVAWEMRKATPEVFKLTAGQNALIESLAKISDAGGNSSLWIGHYLSQLEKGTLSLADFQKQIALTLNGLVVFGPVMGNTAQTLAQLNAALSKFQRTSTDGWGTTTPGAYVPAGQV